MTGRRVLLALCALLVVSNALYLPGVAPREYTVGEKVELKVNKLSSSNSALSFDYYDAPFCRPSKIRNAAENLGEHLEGDEIHNSAYDLHMHVNETCKILCPRSYTSTQIKSFLQLIQRGYDTNWIIDNLPVAATGITTDGSILYSRGFPIGAREVDTKKVFLYNHVRMNIKFHKSPDYEGSRIVGFEVHPMSVKQETTADSTPTNPKIVCPSSTGYLSSATAESSLPRQYIFGEGIDRTVVDVIWSYDVFWTPSKVRWASRWDIYLSMGDRYSDDIHWFAIVNSVIIALFLTGLVAMILVRALYRDFSRYNRVATDEEKAEDKEETGWKLVHGDVFRAPDSWPLLFAGLAGIGTQVLGMAVFTILFAAVGFLSPANRGSLMVGLLVLFLLMGAAAGYTAARTHKFFDGRTYQRTTMMVAFGFPGLVFSILFVLNLFVWRAGSVNAVGFGSMFTVLALWLLISVPLVFVGAYFGFKAEKIKIPVSISPISRPIPEQPSYLSPTLAMVVGGLLPFGCVFVELFFIMSSMWLEQYYYVFGFLLLVFILLAITCAEISIVMCYFQLCAEDYQWWWRSFLTPAASGVYLFLYSIMYYKSRLHMADSTSVLVYFSYMALVSVTFGVVTGTIGYLSTFAFLRTIFGAIKVD